MDPLKYVGLSNVVFQQTKINIKRFWILRSHLTLQFDFVQSINIWQAF